MINYKLVKPIKINGESEAVFKITEGVEHDLYVPFDPRNSDYKDYLIWLSEGNTPEPADK